jgi:hypothetical protein
MVPICNTLFIWIKLWNKNCGNLYERFVKVTTARVSLVGVWCKVSLVDFSWHYLFIKITQIMFDPSNPTFSIAITWYFLKKQFKLARVFLFDFILVQFWIFEKCPKRMTGCCASSDLKSDNNENDLKRNKVRFVVSVFISIQKPENWICTLAYNNFRVTKWNLCLWQLLFK